MLRRPPTSIELKLDDINEYEQLKQSKMRTKALNDTPEWQTGPKSKQEIYNRVGYVPPTALLQARSNLANLL